MEIPDFYRDRSVLVTGVTGFIGKAILEKLLRCCPDVEQVYVLVRPKRGADPKQRVSKLLSLPLFAGCPISRVTGVAGDITLPGFGLSPDDMDAVTANVSVVIHSAATVSFQEPLSVAVKLNLQATAHLEQLARKMKKLVALVHVSTAYSNCDKADIREEIYPPPADVKEILRRAKEEDEKSFNMEAPRLLGRRPNTYTFTKALAENVWSQDGADLPVAIVRPSIVGWAWRDPAPGYADSPNGVIGPYASIAQGLLRSVHCDPTMTTDVVPVDLVVNTVLAVAWYTAGHPAQDPVVYNCVMSASNPIKWGNMLHYWLKEVQEKPALRAVWHPGCSFTPSWTVHQIRAALLHMLPAYVYDVFAPLFGKPATMLKIQRKQSELMKSICFFSTHEWRFSDGNVRRLLSQLSARDRLLFPIDVSAVDWESYIKNAVMGTKRYLLREKEAVSSSGLYALHRLAQAALLSVVVVLIGWLSRPMLERLWPWRLVRFIRFLISQHLF